MADIAAAPGDRAAHPAIAAAGKTQLCLCQWRQSRLVLDAGGARHRHAGTLALPRHDAEPPIGYAASRRCRRIVIDSHATATRFANNAAAAVDVVYNGIDLAWFQRGQTLPRPALLQPTWRAILTIAPLLPDKNHHLLLDAFDAMAGRHPDLHLVCIGDEIAEYKQHAQELYEHSKDLALDSLVHWLGSVADLRPWLAHASMLVMPSEHEPVGRAAIEAMSMGLPVLAVNAGAAPEVIGSADNALLVEPADPLALAAGIDRILLDQDLRTQYNVNGRIRAREFSLDAHVRKMTAVFDAIVGFGE